MPSHRIDRLNKDIQLELASLIPALKDPRIDSLVSVMRVEVTNDMSYAKVYVGSVNGFEKAKEASAVLKNAAGHLRSQLSKNMRIRKAPELRFIPDDSTEYYQKINRILEGFKHDDTDTGE